jgi:hypothetical protein
LDESKRFTDHDRLFHPAFSFVFLRYVDPKLSETARLRGAAGERQRLGSTWLPAQLLLQQAMACGHQAMRWQLMRGKHADNMLRHM